MADYYFYASYVQKCGHFLVSLTDNRSGLRLPDEDYNRILDEWITPLSLVSNRVFVYQRRSKTRPFDVTPPPRSPKPLVISRTPVRVELDFRKMSVPKYREYWLWALRHRNIVFCFGEDNFPITLLAAKCWNPAILLNLGAVIASGAIKLAKRYSLKNNVCCIVRGNSSDVTSVVFAPRKKLAELYKQVVINCQFTHPAFEREFAAFRRQKKKRR